MSLPSTRDYPPGQVGVGDILTGQEYDIQPVELAGETVYRWVCHPCGGQTGGVAYGQTAEQAYGSYIQHYARRHN